MLPDAAHGSARGVSIGDTRCAVSEKATMPAYHESRIAHLGPPPSGERALQAFDIELLHLKHGLKGQLGIGGVGVGE